MSEPTFWDRLRHAVIGWLCQHIRAVDLYYIGKNMEWMQDSLNSTTERYDDVLDALFMIAYPGDFDYDPREVAREAYERATK